MNKTPRQIFWQTEVQPALDAGTSIEEVVFTLVSIARRERDKTILALSELRTDLDNHREFWRRGREDLEDAKLLASQAHTRAQRLQKRERERRGQYRRAADEENAMIRANLERAIQVMKREAAAAPDGMPSKFIKTATLLLLQSLSVKAPPLGEA